MPHREPRACGDDVRDLRVPTVTSLFTTARSGPAAGAGNADDSGRFPHIETAGRQHRSGIHAGCVPGALVLPSGFILPLGTTSITVPLEPPGVTRRERLQQLDLRLSKTFRVDTLTIAPMLEAYNVLNSDKVFGYQSANYANSSGTCRVAQHHPARPCRRAGRIGSLVGAHLSQPLHGDTAENTSRRSLRKKVNN